MARGAHPGSPTEDPGRLRLNVLRPEEVHRPAARVSTLGQHLRVHDRVSPGIIRRAPLDRDVVREVERQARSDIETTGSGSAAASWSSDAEVARRADARACATNLAAASPSRALASCSIGPSAYSGSISSSRRRSTTSWSADAVTATAQPR